MREGLPPPVCHVVCVMCHVSCITCHSPHVTCNVKFTMWWRLTVECIVFFSSPKNIAMLGDRSCYCEIVRKWDLEILIVWECCLKYIYIKNNPPRCDKNVSNFICHLSFVMCHVSSIMCIFYIYFFVRQSCWAIWWRVCGLSNL